MLSTELRDGFTEYNPFETKLTDTLYWSLGPIAQKAKPYINHRSIEELLKILQFADRCLRTARDNALPEILKLSDEYQSDLEDGFFHNECTALYLCFDTYDASSIDSKTPWCEVFATIALAYVGLLYSADKYKDLKADEVIQELSRFKETPSNDLLQTNVAETFIWHFNELKQYGALHAMEALSYAGVLKIEEIRNQANQARTQASTQTKRSSYAPAKLWVCKEYQLLYNAAKLRDEKLSIDYAAEALYPDLPLHLLPSGIKKPKHRTLVNWISDFRNSKLKNVPDLPPFEP